MSIDIAFRNLNSKIKKCRRCRLAKSRVNVLCGEGNLHAELMLIAQAPGGNEDREGKMFIGPSGKVLDELPCFGRILFRIRNFAKHHIEIFLNFAP